MLPPKILTPYDIAACSLKNRFAVAPMTRVSATEHGHATPEMVRYYERFARGGFGLVITEGIYTDQQHSQGYAFQPGLTDDAQAHAWRAITDGIHQHQGKVFAQIMHAGALSQGNRFVDTPAAPSALRPKGEQMAFYRGEGPYQVPRAMTENDIADAIDGFARAAALAVNTAGFDGLEIHGANGYLLDQFLTDYTNQRNDRWGGGLAQRIKLILEVVKAVKAAAGKVPTGVRISQGKVNDFEHKWAEQERAAEMIFGSLREAGVDFIHVTEHDACKPAFSEGGPSLVELARRYAPATTLIANGGLHTPEQLSRSLDDGADVIAIGKAALANPDLPKRLASGTPLADFDGSLLGPIANIKQVELTAS